LRLRASILHAVRTFFAARGYLEVETPYRIPAPAPEAHIDAVASGDWYLHTSPELCMKRLLAAGYDRVFQICRCFREGERGGLHLPEFTLLEWYRIGVDYRALMEECEDLIRFAGKAAGRGETLFWRGREVHLQGPWLRITVSEAFARFAGTTPQKALADGAFEEVLVGAVEPGLARFDAPVFLIDYPSELAALARRKPGSPEVAERFELYVAGLELANAFSELSDPIEQRARFEAEAAARRSAGRAVYPQPGRFLEDLAAMPEAAGIALGVDRLVMVLTGAETIDEVVAFVPEEL
jgi:lysyl-tRNA synthetase class 2